MIFCARRFDVFRGLAAAMLLSGCGGPDKAEKAELVPVGPRDFEYHVTTDQYYPPNAQGGAEGARLQWLAYDVQVASLCSGAYDILSRQVIFQYQTPLGYPVDEIIYRGRCRA